MKIVDSPKVTGTIVSYNQVHEYTKRVPTFRSKKQQERDSKIVAQIVRAHDVENDVEKMLDIFFKKQHLLSDPVYWEVLRTVWIAGGSTRNAGKFKPYFLSKRQAESWFMTPEDKEAFDNMKFPIILYRAYDTDEDPGISWTSDRNWCEAYSKLKGKHIKSKEFSQNDIYAFISRRGESEFIIM